MQIGEFLSVGLLVAGILSAIGAYINTRRKRAQKAGRAMERTAERRTSAPSAPSAPEPVMPQDAPADLLSDLRSKEWRIRLAAVEELLKDASDDTAQRLIFALLPLLNDPDSDVREAVIAGLVRGGQAAIHGLVDTLEHGDVNAREGAARALGQIGGKIATDALIAALADDSAWVRIPAAQGLGAMSAQKAVDPLIACLEDEDAGVRSAAVEALTAIGTRKALMAVSNR